MKMRVGNKMFHTRLVTLKKTARKARCGRVGKTPLPEAKEAHTGQHVRRQRENPKAANAGKRPEGHGLPEKSRIM